MAVWVNTSQCSKKDYEVIECVHNKHQENTFHPEKCNMFIFALPSSSDGLYIPLYTHFACVGEA